MQPASPFDAALAELLRAWRAHDDLRGRTDEVPLEESLAAWLALDRARTWVGAFDGAGRQPGYAGPAAAGGRCPIRGG
ncbi:hypothetical protein BH23ACT9_BH23ACT9_05180 [soil metagenome]